MSESEDSIEREGKVRNADDNMSEINDRIQHKHKLG